MMKHERLLREVARMLHDLAEWLAVEEYFDLAHQLHDASCAIYRHLEP